MRRLWRGSPSHKPRPYIVRASMIWREKLSCHDQTRHQSGGVCHVVDSTGFVGPLNWPSSKGPSVFSPLRVAGASEFHQHNRELFRDLTNLVVLRPDPALVGGFRCASWVRLTGGRLEPARDGNKRIGCPGRIPGPLTIPRPIVAKRHDPSMRAHQIWTKAWGGNLIT